jgi:hypothetical protein
MKNEYNGWTNYETWLVKHWIDSEEGEYLYWKEATEELLGTIGIIGRLNLNPSKSARVLADHLQDHYEDQAIEAVGSTGLMFDLLGGALDRANWHEIAESIIESVKDEQRSAQA